MLGSRRLDAAGTDVRLGMLSRRSALVDDGESAGKSDELNMLMLGAEGRVVMGVGVIFFLGFNVLGVEVEVVVIDDDDDAGVVAAARAGAKEGVLGGVKTYTAAARSGVGTDVADDFRNCKDGSARRVSGPRNC